MPAGDFSRLELLCKRAATLPVLPTTALQLIRTIDAGEASAGELEKIIVSDPSLSAEFLRISSHSDLGKPTVKINSIRAGIIRMGQRSVRALATSVLVRDLAHSEGGSLDKKRFARHSLAVGLIAKYLYARRKMQGNFETAWSADEVFAAGLLSDISYVLLAKMLSDTYSRLLEYACKRQSTLDEMFCAAFGSPASGLGAAAAETWELPMIFRLALAHIDAPWECREEFSSLCCLNYANALSKDFGLGIEEWPTNVSVSSRVAFEIGLEEEERENLKEVVLGQLDRYGEEANSRAA